MRLNAFQGQTSGTFVPRLGCKRRTVDTSLTILMWHNRASGETMPQNTETVQAFYEALGRGDISFVLGVLHPQVEWNEAENFIYADGNPYIGPQAVLQGVFARLGGEWDGFSAIPEKFLESGDTVVSVGRYRGTYKRTGVTVNAQFVHVFTLKDGELARFQQYTDTAQFRDAAGRSTSANA
jgi:ketosteroid isomerase-like protein